VGEFFKVSDIKNALICFGIYYISKWVTLPLALGFGKLTQGIVYSGDFEWAFVGPIVLHLPLVLVAAGAGAALIRLVDSVRPLGWVVLLSLIYLLFGFFNHHGARWTLLDYWVFKVAGALFPALSCVLVGIVSNPRRTRP